MGKSLPSPTRLKEFARVATKKLNSKPNLEENPFHNKPETTSKSVGGVGGGGLKLKKMENPQIPNRMPLSEVVTDCSKRWFQEAGCEIPRFFMPETSTSGGGGGGGSIGGDSEKFKLMKMENLQTMNRMPLSEVVSDCVKSWFQDTLKAAKAGDISMQVLVGQMYYSGYGVTSDDQKGRAWITRASRKRSSVWKVSDKRPGYNESDSDSDELKDDMKLISQVETTN